jgi:hypothetical protein
MGAYLQETNQLTRRQPEIRRNIMNKKEKMTQKIKEELTRRGYSDVNPFFQRGAWYFQCRERGLYVDYLIADYPSDLRKNFRSITVAKIHSAQEGGR